MNEWQAREIIYTQVLWCTSVNISRRDESLELDWSCETSVVCFLCVSVSVVWVFQFTTVHK